MRAVIGCDGKNYRLNPKDPKIVQVQGKTLPYRWSNWFTAKVCTGLDKPGYTAEDRASAMLASIGRRNEGLALLDAEATP